MKQFFKTFFAALLALIVGGVIIAGVLIGIGITAASSLKSSEEESLLKSSVLSIDLSNPMNELGSENADKYAVLLAGKDYRPGLYQAMEAIRFAATDDKIKAIYLNLNGFSEGWATAQQLRETLAFFKSKNKKIYAYGENISQKDYYIGSVANTIYLTPTGMLWLKGLASEMTFYKGTFDKLGVQPEIFYAGKFKSFTEPFRAKEMSEPNRQQIAAIHDAIWVEVVNAISEKTGADSVTVNGWIQTGAIQFPTQAAQFKLVDALNYQSDMEELIRKENGIKDYPKKGEALPEISLVKYADRVRDESPDSDNRIALLIAEGDIVDGTGTSKQIASEDFVKTIRKILADDEVKAVVLRINSGGGSALASEVILHELNRFKEKNIPLLVSMGDVAASGGYYMASGADSIFALPNTITGSIGVFTMMFNLAPLASDKLGITFDVQKNAPYADYPTFTRSATPDEARRTQASVDTIYQTFLRRVAAGRHMTVAEVDSIAQGRVWSGRAALANGLVDGIGGLDRAFAAAKKLSKIDKYEVEIYPEPSDALREKIRSLMGAQAGQAAVKEMAKAMNAPAVDALLKMEDMRKNSGRIMATIPFEFTIR